MGLLDKLLGRGAPPPATARPTRLSFPVLELPGDRAVAELEARLAVPGGPAPILLGDAGDLARLEEGCQDPAPVDEVLADALRLDLDAWYAHALEDDELDDEDPELLGEWPARAEPHRGPIAHLDLRTQRPKPRVLLGLVPAAEPWHLPAHLGIGGWNACPDTHVHAALARRWWEEYGARIVAITGDTIEFRADRPPRGREASLALAREQLRYCSDIVTQGVGSIRALAATLDGARDWYFWWD